MKALPMSRNFDNYYPNNYYYIVIASDHRERGNPTKSSRGIEDAVAISVWDCFVTSFLAVTIHLTRLP